LLHGPMQADFRGVTRDAESAGDFLMRQAFDLAETYHRPRVLRQLLKRLREGQARKDRGVVGRRLLGRRIVDTSFSAQVGATAHQRHAHGQSGKPRVEATVLFVLAESDRQREEYFLHDIVGVILGVGPPAGHLSDQRLVVPVETFKPVRVTRGDIVSGGVPFDHVRQSTLEPRPRSGRVIILYQCHRSGRPYRWTTFASRVSGLEYPARVAERGVSPSRGGLSTNLGQFSRALSQHSVRRVARATEV